MPETELDPLTVMSVLSAVRGDPFAAAAARVRGSPRLERMGEPSGDNDWATWARVLQDPAGFGKSALQHLTGVQSLGGRVGNEIVPPVDMPDRYQTWPEKVARSGATAPSDAWSGALGAGPALSEERLEAMVPRAVDMTALAGAPVPAEAGAAGVFGGKLARTANLPKMRRAYEMEAAGADPVTIWKDTGWFQGADKKWRFEIPDTEAAVLRPQPSLDFGMPQRGALGDVLHHPAAYEAYPWLRDISTTVRRGPEGSGTSGQYHPRTGIELTTPNEWGNVNEPFAGLDPAIFHEMQHPIQEKEEFARGSSTQTERERLALKNRYTDEPTIERLRAEILAGNYGGPGDGSFLEAARNLLKLEDDWRQQKATSRYLRQAGEVEARNVEDRWGQAAEGINRGIPPFLTEDTPRSRQIVTFRSDTQEPGAGVAALSRAGWPPNAENVIEGGGRSSPGKPAPELRVVEGAKELTPAEGAEYRRLMDAKAREDAGIAQNPNGLGRNLTPEERLRLKELDDRVRAGIPPSMKGDAAKKRTEDLFAGRDPRWPVPPAPPGLEDALATPEGRRAFEEGARGALRGAEPPKELAVKTIPNDLLRPRPADRPTGLPPITEPERLAVQALNTMDPSKKVHVVTHPAKPGEGVGRDVVAGFETREEADRFTRAARPQEVPEGTPKAKDAPGSPVVTLRSDTSDPGRVAAALSRRDVLKGIGATAAAPAVTKLLPAAAEEAAPAAWASATRPYGIPEFPENLGLNLQHNPEWTGLPGNERWTVYNDHGLEVSIGRTPEEAYTRALSHAREELREWKDRLDNWGERDERDRLTGPEHEEYKAAKKALAHDAKRTKEAHEASLKFEEGLPHAARDALEKWFKDNPRVLRKAKQEYPELGGPDGYGDRDVLHNFSKKMTTLDYLLSSIGGDDFVGDFAKYYPEVHDAVPPDLLRAYEVERNARQAARDEHYYSGSELDELQAAAPRALVTPALKGIEGELEELGRREESGEISEREYDEARRALEQRAARVDDEAAAAKKKPAPASLEDVGRVADVLGRAADRAQSAGTDVAKFLETLAGAEPKTKPAAEAQRALPPPAERPMAPVEQPPREAQPVEQKPEPGPTRRNLFRGILKSDTSEPGRAVAGAAAARAEPLYSAAQRAVEQFPKERAPAQEWWPHLEKSARADELDWLGLEDLLGPRGTAQAVKAPREAQEALDAWKQANPRQRPPDDLLKAAGEERQRAQAARGLVASEASKRDVTRQELLDWVRGHQAEVREVRKGGEAERVHPLDDPETARDFELDIENGEEHFYGVLAEQKLKVEKSGDRHRVVGEDGTLVGEFATEAEAKKFKKDVEQDRLTEDQELINDHAYDLAHEAADAEWGIGDGAKGGPRYGPETHPDMSLPGGDNYGESLLTLPERNAPTSDPYEARRRDVEGDTRDFRSSHWEEPNVLAHVRHTDRTIDGKRSLHLEEVQSDWHQQGRKRGYRRELTEKELARKGELETKIQRDPARRLPPGEAQELNALAGAAGAGVPDAPFKSTWPDLALKRMVRKAAEEGYDSLSWTPGDAHADRYTQYSSDDKIRRGQRGFYDRDLVAKANKIGEKYGARVEQKDLEPSGEKYEVKNIGGGAWDIRDGRGNVVDQFNDRAEAQDALERMTASASFGKPVWVLKITPALRRAALQEGFPLWQRGAPLPGHPDQGEDYARALRAPEAPRRSPAPGIAQ